MKVFLIGLLSQALFCSLVLGDDDDKQTMPINQITPYNTKFAYTLFSHLAAKNPTGNIFLSHLSISVAFSMLSLGARSNTLSEILEGLGFNTTALPAEDIHEGFQQLLQVLNQHDEDAQLNMANALFVSKDRTLLQKFLDDAKKYYESETIPTDFQNTAQALNQINGYVERKTNGTIKNLLSSVDTRTLLVLVNTILFTGKWEHAFNKTLTKEENFHVDENTVVKVQMMTRKEVYRVASIQDPGCVVVKVPYKGNISAILILPDEGKLAGVEQALGNGSLQTWTKQLIPRDVILSLPRVSISNRLDLISELSDLGMQDVFSDNANFSGITNGPLKVSQAVHQAVLKMDEEGTVAAAATAIGVTVTSVEIPLSVKFDHTFLMFIVHDNTGTILFNGRIARPEE